MLVFDAGRLVEQGHHDDLVAAGGIYAGLHRSWIGATRTRPGRPAELTRRRLRVGSA